MLVFADDPNQVARIEHGTSVQVELPGANPIPGIFHCDRSGEGFLLANEADVLKLIESLPLHTRVIVAERTQPVRAFNHEWSGTI